MKCFSFDASRFRLETSTVWNRWKRLFHIHVRRGCFRSYWGWADPPLQICWCIHSGIEYRIDFCVFHWCHHDAWPYYKVLLNLLSKSIRPYFSRIFKNIVGFTDLFEFFPILWLKVWMILLRKSKVSSLYLLLGGPSCHPQQFVRIFSERSGKSSDDVAGK